MTVEQTPLGHFHIPEPKDYDSALRWLKEVTEVNDPQILNEALEASKKEYGIYDMDQAIAFVMQENDRKNELQQEPEVSRMQVPLPHREQSCAQKVDVPAVRHQQTDSTDAVIDLTNESEKDDLQKAIALSLQEQHGVFGGQVTTEEQDISRVLEASLLESKVVGTKRKRGEVWQDPLNPYDRQRNGDWPVGLKNVGNTCWFAAVIQSLFHLPAFRHLVLNFSMLKEWECDGDNTPPHSLLFMRELRKLFALMVATERKYVDPSRALEVVREAFTNSASTDNQQDVSEFSHKLIEWLEDAYKLNSTDHSSDARNANPMTKLFYGRLKSEGLNGEYSSCHEAKFGQYPLQMNGFSEIHESLESAVVAQEIESCGSGSASKFGQETWFTQLPPVLVFELSRFHFNQLLGVPEKIHNRFEFPEVIYMDRYLEKNKVITRTKRELVRKLKEDRGKLLRRLEKYMNYGSGSKRVPLQDVLQFALEFVETKPEPNPDLFNPTTGPQEDIEMTSPQVNRSVEVSPVPSSARASFPSSSCVSYVHDAEATPCPRHITDMELSVFQTCLNRWRMEVEADVKDLQDEVSRADTTIKEIYNESTLQKVPYRLHAVLVHEGQAVSGHYWAYVYSPQRETWLKFNDITVTEATWTDLLKESMGGYHHASAYCLMYVDEGSEKLFQGDSISCMKDLKEDLQNYVSSDNSNFCKEKENWDLEQSCKKECSTMTSETIDTPAPQKYLEYATEVTSVGSPTHFGLHTPQLEHASLALKRTTAKLEALLKEPGYNLNRLISELLQQDIQELLKLKAQTCTDARVESVGVYFLQNNLPIDPFIHVAVLEQLAHPELDDCFPGNHIVKEFRRKAHEFLSNVWMKLDKVARQQYQEWHERYSIFRKVIISFVTGMEKFQQKKYEEALQYFVDAFAMNSQLVESSMEKQSGLDANILGHYRRKCVLNLNETAVRHFQQEEPPFENVTVLVDEFIVPSMTFLCATNASKIDSDAAVQVRDSWCSMIEFQCSEEKRQFLEEIILKLCETQKEARICKPSVSLRITDLHLKFNDTMLIIKRELQLIEGETMK